MKVHDHSHVNCSIQEYPSMQCAGIICRQKLVLDEWEETVAEEFGCQMKG